ncbi:hypothetical protein [Acinetobacter baumannii]|uniref:hypothetical protein n=1 Tax=Acinetobacter baumannii TaxID=470 RepID=UPI0022EBA1CA|nr:hypothetical protein [Acinetobacter baumannii]MDA3433114.1 hypothetical protein [Acinetobacter baumannii]
MEQIRPFPPTDFIDQAEEEEAIRLIPASDLKKWVIANYLTIGGPRSGTSIKKWSDYTEVERAALARENPTAFQQLLQTKGK